VNSERCYYSDVMDLTALTLSNHTVEKCYNNLVRAYNKLFSAWKKENRDVSQLKTLEDVIYNFRFVILNGDLKK